MEWFCRFAFLTFLYCYPCLIYYCLDCLLTFYCRCRHGWNCCSIWEWGWIPLNKEITYIKIIGDLQILCLEFFKHNLSLLLSDFQQEKNKIFFMVHQRLKVFGQGDILFPSYQSKMVLTLRFKPSHDYVYSTYDEGVAPYS